ncbi:hypothetical protein H7I53_14540 [Mycolicibacterium pulveris]|nr:hypothetical protein [Mycolicibacterium pulveris]MCV6981440.1 hypothetical protein [Mycolicibacterium pulveris]
MDATTGMLDVTPVPGDPTYVPVASTYPTGVFVNWGIGFEVDGAAVIRELDSGGVEGDTYGGGVYQTAMATLRHRVLVTAANAASGGNNRGMGGGVHGSDASFTDGVFFTMDSGASSGGCQIFHKNGATITPVGTATDDDNDDNDTLELRPTLTAGVWTYTVYRNGNPTACAWTDSSNAATPGLYTCFAFQHRRAGGLEFYSNGLRDFTAEDF